MSKGFQSTLAGQGNTEDGNLALKMDAILANINRFSEAMNTMMEAYTLMHRSLVDKLASHHGFDAKTYIQELECKLADLAATKEQLGDAALGLQQADVITGSNNFVKLIIEADIKGKQLSNRSTGGAVYVLGSGRLPSELESALVGKKKGDKFEIDITYGTTNVDAELAGTTVHYFIEIAGIKTPILK